MNKREARRLALLVIWNEIDGSLEASDEWVRHPENDREFTSDEVKKVKDAGRKWLDGFTGRLPKE